MVYLLTFILLLFFVYHYDIQKNEDYINEAFIFLWLIFVLISGLRYHIGADAVGYELVYKNTPSFLDPNWYDKMMAFWHRGHNDRYKIGWIIYSMVMKTLSGNFVALQLSNAFIVNTAIFITIKRYSKLLFMPLLIFACSFTFVSFEFELMREVISVSIFMLWAYPAFIKENWLNYYIVTFISYNFHPSAMVMFLLPLVRNINWNTRQFIYYLIIPSIFLGIFGRMIVSNSLDLIFGADSYASRYYNGGQNHSINYFLMYAYRPSALLALYLVFKKYIDPPHYLVNLFYFSIFWLYIGGLVYTAARFTNYVIIIDYILIGQILLEIFKKYRTMFAILVVLTLYNVPTIYQYSSPISLARHYPYRSIFNPEPNSDQKKMENYRIQKYYDV